MKKLIFFCIFVCGIGLQISKEGVSLSGVFSVKAQSEGDYNWETDIGVGGYWENPDLPDRPDLPNDPIDRDDVPRFDVDDPDIDLPDWPDFDRDDDRGDNDGSGWNDDDRDDGRDDWDNGYDGYDDDRDRDDGREDDRDSPDFGNVDRDDSDDVKNNVIKQMVDYLSEKIKENNEASFMPFPPTYYDPERNGFAFGVYQYGVIKLTDTFFGLPKGDGLSTIIHEYTHYILDINYPVGTNENGAVIQIVTDIPINASDNERQLYREICTRRAEDLKNEGEWVYNFAIENCIFINIEGNYTYSPSNLHLQEILAREAELQGEKNGWYILSDEYRQRIYETMETYKYSYERAINYEKKYGYNSDGTKK